MSRSAPTLQIATSPHIASGASVETIMRHVVWALLPVCLFAIYSFGLSALLLLATAVLSCVGSEYLLNRASGRPNTIRDWSAVITGLLFGLTLPPGLPLWMVAVGGATGVALGKFLFGGLGYNIFNPALVGRAFLQAAFPAAMTHWAPALAEGRFTSVPASTLALPFSAPALDAVSAATPLTQWKFDGDPTASASLLLGTTAGSTGETCAILIVAGGGYLALRRFLNWRIPVTICATVGALSWAMHAAAPARYPAPDFMLFSGGLLLGAVFMATDMVGSPITAAGSVVYGVLIGALITLIRLWSGMPEGVMYAILLGNAVTPHIDALFQPRPFGARGG